MKYFAIPFLLSCLSAVASAQNAAAPAKGGPKAAAKPEAIKPEPIKPAAVTQPAAKPADHTTIDAESSTMDTKNSVATFTGNVDVRSPQFHLTTDGDFEVHMKKQPKPKPAPEAKPGDDKKPDGKAAPAPAPTPTPADAANALSAKPGSPDSGVELAIARGKMVVIEKKDADGKTKIGKCRHATYEGKSGDILLRDWPQVQDGQNLIIATDATTRMVLTKDGHLKVIGRARTDIVGNQSQAQKGQ